MVTEVRIYQCHAQEAAASHTGRVTLSTRAECESMSCILPMRCECSQTKVRLYEKPKNVPCGEGGLTFNQSAIPAA